MSRYDIALKKPKRPKSDICPLCKGDGRDPIQDGGLTKLCRHCQGTGRRLPVNGR